MTIRQTNWKHWIISSPANSDHGMQKISPDNGLVYEWVSSTRQLVTVKRVAS